MFPCFRVMNVQKPLSRQAFKEVIYDCDKYEDTASVIAFKTDDGFSRSKILSVSPDRPGK